MIIIIVVALRYDIYDPETVNRVLGETLTMKGLSILGTAAMFLVGGGILTHGLPPVHHFLEHLAHDLHGIPVLGGTLEVLAPMILNGLFGVVAGSLVVGVVTLFSRFRKSPAPH